MINPVCSNQPCSSGMMQYGVKSLCTLTPLISMLAISTIQNVAAVEQHYASDAYSGSESSLSAYTIVQFVMKTAFMLVICGVALYTLGRCCIWMNAIAEHQINEPDYLDHPPTFLETVTGRATAKRRKYEQWKASSPSF